MNQKSSLPELKKGKKYIYKGRKGVICVVKYQGIKTLKSTKHQFVNLDYFKSNLGQKFIRISPGSWRLKNLRLYEETT